MEWFLHYRRSDSPDFLWRKKATKTRGHLQIYSPHEKYGERCFPTTSCKGRGTEEEKKKSIKFPGSMFQTNKASNFSSTQYMFTFFKF